MKKKVRKYEEQNTKTIKDKRSLKEFRINTNSLKI